MNLHRDRKIPIVKHPIIDDTAKDFLELINEMLCMGHYGEAAVNLGEFLDIVVVVVTTPNKK